MEKLFRGILEKRFRIPETVESLIGGRVEKGGKEIEG